MAHFALDNNYTSFFHSQEEDYPWVELDLKKTYLISAVQWRTRNYGNIDHLYNRMKNVQVRIGNKKTDGGSIVTTFNTLCGTFIGPIFRPIIITVNCMTAIEGRYVLIQKTIPVNTANYNFLEFSLIFIN